VYAIYNGSTATHRHTFLSFAIALIVITIIIIIIISNIVRLEQTPFVIGHRQMGFNDVLSNPLGPDRLHVFDIVSVRFRPERDELSMTPPHVSSVNSPGIFLRTAV
jgi:hypothetical protein